MGRRWIRGGIQGLALWLLIGQVGWIATAETGSPAALTLESLARSCSTPQQLARFLQDEITFKRDTELFGQSDYWQTPEEFLHRGAGDCEDYALLAQAVLHRQGVEALVLSLYGPQGYAHTVCLFAEGGRYNVINQEKILILRAPSLEAAATALFPGWTWGGIAQRAGIRGRLIHKIRNPSL